MSLVKWRTGKNGQNLTGKVTIRSKKLATSRRGMNDISEQVVKRKDFRRQT